MNLRPHLRLLTAVLMAVSLLIVAHIVGGEYESGKVWKEPPVVTPADSTAGNSIAPPSDAIVLFDGADWSKWEGGHWTVKDGVVTAGGSDTHTKQTFGNFQLHLEWAEPATVSGSGQGRGNSGVFLADHYEIQVLDSYKNPTYVDGSCAAVYKQWPPLVNACRKPGEWQTYDIIFSAPQFDGKKLVKHAYVTVLQNNVLVQNHAEILGTTSWDHPPEYEPHPFKQPLRLQFHGNPVRYRNIWIREL